MKTIYKYTLQVMDIQNLELPIHSKILTVQVQNKEPVLWAIVCNPVTATEIRIIEIVGTGSPMFDAKRKYISTIQLNNGLAIFHVFVRRSEK